MSKPRSVLFLCTGNYYRSRFAEILFNHLAQQRGLNWRATSRGIARDFGTWNVGPISPHTCKALDAKGIALPEPMRNPMHCLDEDLSAADLVVAVKEAEHRPMLAKHFAGWEDRAEYWHVHDVDQAHPDVALVEIENEVIALINRLANS
jgi:protein-tyrosine phosphatase